MTEAEIRLGETEVLRKLLTGGLRHDSRTSERHQGPRLRDEDVAE